MKLNFKYMIFADQIKPKGYLTRDKGSHALWYYVMLATKNRAQVGKGPSTQILVVPAGDDQASLWMNKEYEQIARSVAAMYGFVSPDEFQNYWPLIEMEANRLGIVIHDDIRWFEPGKRPEIGSHL